MRPVIASASVSTSSFLLISARPAAAQDPPPLEERVEALEEELERLKLQLPEEGEEADAVIEAPPAAPPPPPNVLNPTITVIGNGLYRADDGPVLAEEAPVDNRFNLREVEVDFRAAVDPFADAVFILALESEVPGEYETGVEDAYVVIKRLPVAGLDQPPLGLQLKVGRFRPEVGRVNLLHLHDLPQTSRPLVTEELFGEEGYVANGGSARVFLPFVDDDSSLELTGQVLTGGGAAVADGAGDSPALVGNLRWFRTFGDAHNVDLSLIAHHGRTDPAARRSAQTYSADALYKWKPLRRGESRSFVLGGQVVQAVRDFLVELDTDGDGEADMVEEAEASPLGYFAFAQLQVARTLYLGGRWDDTATVVDDEARRRAVTGTLSWYVSEFLRFRLGAEHRWSDLAEEDGRDSAFAEVNVVIGAHPPEPFWVNK